MKKKLIRLTENDLHSIIKSSVRQYIKENNFKSHIARMKAAIAIARKEGRITNEEAEEQFAKISAMNDINAELRQQREPFMSDSAYEYQPNEEKKSLDKKFGGVSSYQDEMDDKHGFRTLADEHNAEREFRQPLGFNDIEDMAKYLTEPQDIDFEDEEY